MYICREGGLWLRRLNEWNKAAMMICMGNLFVKSGTISVAWEIIIYKAEVFGQMESLKAAHGSGESFYASESKVGQASMHQKAK